MAISAPLQVPVRAFNHPFPAIPHAFAGWRARGAAALFLAASARGTSDIAQTCASTARVNLVMSSVAQLRTRVLKRHLQPCALIGFSSGSSGVAVDGSVAGTTNAEFTAGTSTLLDTCLGQ